MADEMQDSRDTLAGADAPAPEKAPARRPRKKAVADAPSPEGESAPAEPKKPVRRTRKAASVAEEAAGEEKPKRRTRVRKEEQKDDFSVSPSSEAPVDAKPQEASDEAPAAAAVKDAPKDAPAKAPRRSRTVRVPAASAEEAKTPAVSGGEDKADEPAADAQRPQRHQDSHQNGNGAGANRRRQRRDKHQRNGGRGRNQVVEPKVNKDELAKLKVAELREKAAELEIDAHGLLKADLVEAVFQETMKREGFRNVSGILDIMPDGYGFVRTKGYLPSEGDAYVNQSMIRRNHLRKGDEISGRMRPPRDNEKFGAIQRLDTVNGHNPEELVNRVKFSDLTPIFPDERLTMEHGKNTVTARVIDLTAPIGKGQRGLIVSPPKAGKTTVLKDIAAAITANNPEVYLMCLLVDERPEEVTDMERSIKGEVIASTFDMPSENHIAVAELVIERAKRMVEDGRDVVILLDSITRLARAYNLAQPASGRVLSGGVDSTALYPPKRFLGAARNIENGGSLTILASALIETGSKMDEVIFEEFKGTGNMELRLDRSLADRRIFPAIDPVTSGTRREDLLLDPQQAPLIWAVRRILANLNNTERAMNMLIKSLRQTDTNTEFLLKTAKKMQGRAANDIVEF